MIDLHKTIVAIATNPSNSALGIVRISGKNAIIFCDKVFKSKKKLKDSSGYEAIYGKIVDNNTIIDEVIATVFRAPRSFTGYDTVEFSCHGSPYILSSLVQLLIHQGAQLAKAGEFTQMAFLNGKMDLSQAEAIADLIASESKTAHEIAIKQLKGGFSNELKHLRQQLIEFTALLELELDFAEEDVEFANRKQLINLLQTLQTKIQHLSESFIYGNAVKEGLPVAIVGKPNAGKSSLLNALFKEEKAIVSNIAGTTRDVIEDVLILNGIKFRFIDTAGLRQTNDEIEAIGVKKARDKAQKAKIILYMYDQLDITPSEIIQNIEELYSDGQFVIIIANKIDLLGGYFEDDFKISLKQFLSEKKWDFKIIAMQTNNENYINALKVELTNYTESLKGNSETIVTNLRHVEALQSAQKSLTEVLNGLQQNISSELLAFDLKQAITQIASITGEIEIDRDILGTIFSRFCIGK